MTRIRTSKEAELDRLHLGDAKQLLAFNITKQRIADRANEDHFCVPGEQDKAYSTWHRALDGKPVWDEIVKALESLLAHQKLHPRAYLPGPPTDDLRSWMRDVAGAKWWHETLGLSFKENTLTGWMSGRSISAQNEDELRGKVQDWWSRVDAACTQAELVQQVHTFEKAEREVYDGPPPKRAWTWDSYLYSYVHEDGHSVDDARAQYVEMLDLAYNNSLTIIDLANPQPPCVPFWETRDILIQQRPRDHANWARDFDRLWASGLPRAIPRKRPDDFDATPYEEVGQWPDRRMEEGPSDANEHLYRLHYKTRVEPFWDDQARSRSSVHEIVAVSEDGETWRAPTDLEKKGWDNQSDAIARYRVEHDAHPDNAYTREVNEAWGVVRKLRGDISVWKPSSGVTLESLEAKLRAAEAAVERARNDY